MFLSAVAVRIVPVLVLVAGLAIRLFAMGAARMTPAAAREVVVGRPWCVSGQSGVVKNAIGCDTAGMRGQGISLFVFGRINVSCMVFVLWLTGSMKMEA